MQMITTFLNQFLGALMGNVFIQLLLIAVCADMVFGSLRAAKYRRWNSAVGIDGAIRKAGMLACVLLFTAMDMMMRIDVLGWVPVEIRTTLDACGIVKMGITELFALLFILYEATSVLKNMLLCGLPVPAGLREKLASWLDTMTDETQVDMMYETGEHSKLSMSMNMEELEHLTLQQLHAMAKEMDVEYKETTTVKELADALAKKSMTTVI